MTEKLEIQVVDGTAVLDEKAIEAIKLLKKIELKMKDMEIQKKEIQMALKEAMKESGTKSFESNDLKVTYVPEHSSTRFDSKAMKEAHPKIYKQFTKEVPVKDSVRIELKK